MKKPSSNTMVVTGSKVFIKLRNQVMYNLIINVSFR